MVHAFQETLKTEDSVFNTFCYVYFEGTLIVFWKNQIYITREQQEKRIIWEDETWRRKHQKIEIFCYQCYVLYTWYMFCVEFYKKEDIDQMSSYFILKNVKAYKL